MYPLSLCLTGGSYNKYNVNNSYSADNNNTELGFLNIIHYKYGNVSCLSYEDKTTDKFQIVAELKHDRLVRNLFCGTHCGATLESREHHSRTLSNDIIPGTI